MKDTEFVYWYFSRYIRSGKRPGAFFLLFPLQADGLTEIVETVPAKHFDEVSRFYSRVAAFPIGHNIS